MKELSIEEKAKRYDEAIEKAGSLYKTAEPMSGCNVLLETVFPELAESEDEKIRKALINGFNKLDKSAVWYNGITNAQILDWLEKQGEHANFRNKIQIGDKVTKNRDGYLINLSQLNRVAKVEEKQGEQKPAGNVEPKFKKGDRVIGIISGMQYYITEVCNDYYYTESGCIIMFDAQDNFNLYEQKSWSEEDEEMLKMVIKLCEQCGNEYAYYWLKSLKDRVQPKQEWSEEDENEYAHILKTLNLVAKEQETKGYNNLISSINWLKFLKDRVQSQPKPEWSEEDEEHIKSLLERLEGMCKKDATFIRTKFAVSEDEDWLKSLSPQNRWKPSNEQMKAFDAILVYNPPCSDECRNHLITLYNELKKLREE